MDLFTFLSKLIWPAIFVYVLIRYEGAIREFLGSLKDWAEISGPGMGMKRKIQVISTLWKHQKEYYPDNPRKGRWSFMVGLGSPSFADYLIGVGQNLKKGLVTINPKDGQCLLTDAGIYYCEGNEGVLLNDWDYERWKK
jgi:hypothetical protein